MGDPRVRRAAAGLIFALLLSLAPVASSAHPGGEEALDRAQALVEKGDKPGAFAAFKEAAEAGNTRAMRLVAHCYKAGFGVAADPKAGIAWYRKAAEAGDIESMQELGSLLTEAREGVKPDFVEAARWLRKSAEMGDGYSLVALGYLYQMDSPIADPSESYAWFRKAAEAGDPQAACEVAYCLLNGRGVRKDEPEAVKWFRTSAERGGTSGMFALGQCLEQGLGTKKDLEGAYLWFAKAASTDGIHRIDAIQKAAWMALQGIGVKADGAKAAEWFLMGGSLGDTWCMVWLADAHRRGKGLPLDFEKAKEWYWKAARKGDPEGYNGLAIMAVRGEGQDPNPATAKSMYIEAAKVGSVNALYNIGLLYYDGEYAPTDAESAVPWFRKAAAKGQVAARNLLGWMQCLGVGMEKNTKQGLRLLEENVSDSDSEGLFKLACLYRDGLAVPRDVERSLEYTNRAWKADPQDFLMLAIWGDLVALGRKDEADLRVRERLEAKQEDSWYTHLLLLVVGKRSAEEILQEAEAQPTERRRSKRSAEAYYYLGRAALLGGRKENAATWFRKCVERKELSFTEHWAATAELGLLEAAGKPEPKPGK